MVIPDAHRSGASLPFDYAKQTAPGVPAFPLAGEHPDWCECNECAEVE